MPVTIYSESTCSWCGLVEKVEGTFRNPPIGWANIIVQEITLNVTRGSCPPMIGRGQLPSPEPYNEERLTACPGCLKLHLPNKGE